MSTSILSTVQSMPKTSAESVNFHLWQPCNMRCKFCFATFQDVKNSILPKGHLPEAEAIKVVQELAGYGFQKITFAGGEPLLCPWLPKLIKTAKELGMTTMIVTNGSKLSDKWLAENRPFLDWITISIDSLNEATNVAAGRAIVGKRSLTKAYYFDLIERVKKFNYRLKINTVVSSANYADDLSEFISFALPERWKIFQVLPIKGQNDACIDEMKVSNQQFQQFLNQHDSLAEKVIIVPENNDAMTNSYVMVDPAGRFFDNSIGELSYGPKITAVGVHEAFQWVSFDREKFLDRGGVYKWEEDLVVSC